MPIAKLSGQSVQNDVVQIGKVKSDIVARFNERQVSQAYHDAMIRRRNAELFRAKHQCLLNADIEPHQYCVPAVCPSASVLQVLGEEPIRRCEFSHDGCMLCILFDNAVKSMEWNAEGQVWRQLDDIRAEIDSKGHLMIKPLAIYLTLVDMINKCDRFVKSLINSRDCADTLGRGATCGYLSVVKKLVSAGALPDLVANLDELTALQRAIRSGYSSMAEYLLRQNADVNKLEPGIESVTLIQRAAMNGNSRLIQMLIEYGADYEATNVYGESPLCHAIRAHDFDSVNLLLSLNVKCDFCTDRLIGVFAPFSVDEGAAPLHMAVHEGSYPILKRLLQHGVDMNIKTKGWGDTALKKAYWGETHGDPVKMTALLLSYGAEINAPAIFSHPEKPLSSVKRHCSAMLVLAMHLYQGDVGQPLIDTLDGRKLKIPARVKSRTMNSLPALAAQSIWLSLWRSMELRMIEWLYVSDKKEIMRELSLTDEKVDYLRFGSLLE